MDKRGLAFLIMALLLFTAGVLLLTGRFSAQDSGQPTTQSPEDLNRAFDDAIARARAAVEAFVRSGNDPCKVRLDDSESNLPPRYDSLASLVNDVDLIVEGDLGVSSLATPRPNSAAARITTEFIVRDVIVGSTSTGTVLVEAGGIVRLDGGELVRTGRPNFDQCSVNHVMLFLEETESEGVFRAVQMGFVTFSDSATDATQSSDLFASGTTVDSLKADVRRMAEDQQARELPKGRLICESRHDSVFFQDPMACPGDSFNPYEAFGLARVLEIDIRKTDAQGLELAALGDVPTDTPSAVTMLTLLDRSVQLEPGREPVGEQVSVNIITATSGTPPYGVVLEYEVVTDSIWLPASGGQFPAPEGFGEALDVILQGS